MIFDLTTLIFLGLAAFRIARFITSEKGPFQFMFKIRFALDPEQDSDLLRCPHCVGVWSALIVLGLYLLAAGPASWVIYLLWWFAITGFVSLAHDLVMK